MIRVLMAGTVATVLLSSVTAFAADAPVLTIKDHKFSPETLAVPAGKRIKVTITNADSTAEEFDSSDLHIEKMIPGGQKASIFIGPLKPGVYRFVGELHESTARGKVVAK